MFIFQVVCVPFAWFHEAVEPITWDSRDWVGEITPGWEYYYADYMLLLTFGGIPWQVKLMECIDGQTLGCPGDVLRSLLDGSATMKTTCARSERFLGRRNGNEWNATIHAHGEGVRKSLLISRPIPS